MINQDFINQGRQLRTSVIDDDLKTAKELIKTIGVNVYIDHTVNPFILACIHQKTELVNYCLENGADANLLYWPNYKFSPIMREDNSCSMLGYGCGVGNLELVKLLLAHHANPNFTNKAGISVLQKLLEASGNRAEILTLLLQNGADINTPMTFNDNQTFLEAIMQWETRKDLLDVVNIHNK
jgi:ankyrin repeat protein